ncbi:MAG: glycosyltransferase [Candidatus Krumholzibacteriia bacterium]|nr:glycosyltransferase [bacterium]MCB9514370.1 glycosyltransferase [Candidatus Latescibacterota bacterium]MCB9516640.1 glycosyltransferase [Candidatus Latescibacterota bacterium]
MHFLFPYLARYRAVNWTRYHHLFGQLATMGHRITVLQPPPADIGETNFQEIDVELPENIRLFDVPMPGLLWNRRWPLDKLVKKGSYGLACRDRVARIFAEDPADALLVYNLPQAGMLHVAPLAGRKLVRVFDLADDYEAMLATELGRFAWGPLLWQGKRTLHRMIDDADLVLSVSHSLADDYPNRDIHVLPNGVDFARFEGVRASVDGRVGTGDDHRLVVGYLGAFEYFIDFPLILDMAERMPDTRFRLVGAGRDFEHVRSEAARRGLDNVELPGPVPFNRVPAEIAAMDVCLNTFVRIPISHKASPMKLFEYLAMGRPVLTTDLDEVRRYGVDFLVTVNTAEEAVAALRRLAADPAERAWRAEAGRDWVRASFDWKDIANRLVELVERCTDRMD